MFKALFLVAQAAAVPNHKPDPTFYECEATPRSGAFGKIWYRMDVPVDGSESFHRIQWHIPDRADGLDLYVQEDRSGPFINILDDRSTVFVKFRTTRRIRDEVRIEIRRMVGERYPTEFAFAGPYLRPYHFPNSQFYYVEAQGRWGELNAWMRDRELLTFALVKRDGSVVAEDRLNATTLADAATAIAAIRPEMEALAVDYRRKCKVPEPIILAH